MRQIAHQTQTLGNSCVAACVAMLAGVQVVGVEMLFNDRFHIGEVSARDMLKHHRIEFTRLYADERAEMGHIYLVHACSLTEPGRFHMVVLDARTSDIKVFDPAMGFTDEQYEAAHYYWPEGEPPSRKGVALTSFLPVIRIDSEEFYNDV